MNMLTTLFIQGTTTKYHKISKQLLLVNAISLWRLIWNQPQFHKAFNILTNSAWLYYIRSQVLCYILAHGRLTVGETSTLLRPYITVDLQVSDPKITAPFIQNLEQNLKTKVPMLQVIW